MILSFTRSTPIALAALVVAAVARAQRVERVPSDDDASGERFPKVYESLGRSLAGVRLGGEKPRDLIAAGVTRNGSGRVVLLAPRSRQVVMELGADVGGEFFGESLASSGSTLLIGESIALQGRGRVRVVDVDRPDEARWLEGFEGAERFGLELLVVPDASGAGFVALIAAPTTPGADDARGAVAIYRDARGEPIWIQRAVRDDVGFGRTLAALGDVDADGTSDFAVSSLRGARGAVSVLSGKDGRRLREWVGHSDGDGFGTGLAGVPDLDGDGRSDLAIGVPLQRCEAGTSGRVRLVSTATGALLREITSDCRASNRPGGDAEFGAVLGFEPGATGPAGALFVAAPEGYFGGTDVGYVESWTPDGVTRTSRFGWDYGGFRPERFGRTVEFCSLTPAESETVVLVGGQDDDSSGLSVRRAGTHELVWEVFASNLLPPD